MNRHTAIQACRVVTLAAFAAGMATATLTAGVSRADHGCPAAASVCTYRVPASTQAARDACYEQATDTLGPVGNTPAWRQAVRRCQDDNPPPGGKWNWDGMTLVGWR